MTWEFGDLVTTNGQHVYLVLGVAENSGGLTDAIGHFSWDAGMVLVMTLDSGSHEYIGYGVALPDYALKEWKP